MLLSIGICNRRLLFDCVFAEHGCKRGLRTSVILAIGAELAHFALPDVEAVKLAAWRILFTVLRIIIIHGILLSSRLSHYNSMLRC